MPFGDQTLPSNLTGTFFALETVFKEVPNAAGTQWYPIEPNEYSDFGSTIEKEARTPITADRQNRKGVVINETAQAGYTHDMVQDTMAELFKGFMFDDWKDPVASLNPGAADDLSVVVSGTPEQAAVTSAGAIDWTALGLIPGEWIYIGDGTNALDDKPGFFRILSIDSPTVITCDRFPVGLADDAGGGKTIPSYYARSLRTQDNPANIQRHSYTFQRQLEDGLQYEFVTGCVANTYALTIPTTGKLTAEVGVVGASSSYAPSSSLGVFNDLTAEEAYSAAMPGVEMRLIYENGADAFTFVSEATLNIDNGITPVNAVGYLGGIDMSSGNFMGTGEVTAYFTNYAAIEAIKANDSVGLLLAMAAQNKGWLFDLPYVSLGGGLLNVAQNEPITIPLEIDGSKHPVFLHTMIVHQFDELPDVAAT